MARYRIVARGGYREHVDHYTVERANEYRAFGFWPTYRWTVVEICETRAEAISFIRRLMGREE